MKTLTEIELNVLSDKLNSFGRGGSWNPIPWLTDNYPQYEWEYVVLNSDHLPTPDDSWLYIIETAGLDKDSNENEVRFPSYAVAKVNGHNAEKMALKSSDRIPVLGFYDLLERKGFTWID